MPRLSPVDRRLAARFHQRQVEVAARAEAVAEAVGVHVKRAIARVKGHVADGLDVKDAGRITMILRALTPELVAELEDLLARMTTWAYDATAQALLDSVPIAWWKAAIPTLPIDATEAREPPPQRSEASKPLMSATDFFMDPNRVNVTFEPVVAPVGRRALLATVKAILFPPLPRDTVRAIVRAPNPQTGATWQERLTTLSRKVGSPESLARALTTGIALGEDLRDLTGRVDQVVGPLHGTSKMIARTEAIRVAEVANRQTWEPIEDIMAGVQIVAVLDERTRPEHAARNGRVYWKGGDPPFEQAPQPPDAPNCRCTLVPVMKPPSEIATNPALQAAFQNAEGDFAPDPLAYDQWFRAASEPRRRLAVGSGRYSWMKSKVGRAPEWGDFVTPEGKLIPIDVLKRESDVVRLARRSDVQLMMRRQADYLRQVAATGFVSG